jgi:hypothetical protein
MEKAKFAFGLFIFFVFSLGAFSAGQQKSDKELPFFAQDRDGNRIDLYRESYALIIGIDHYTAGWPDLPGVAKDIEDVKKEIMKQGFRVTVAKNLDRDKLLSTIEGFISKYGHDPENRLLIYFAGHGHTIKLATGVEMGYIVPADAPNPNMNDLGFKDKAIDMMRFDNFAQQIECKHVLFIFDSCFSGSIFALSRGAVPEVISYKTARPVRQFITSGSADEMVPDKSVFKSQFVSGIEGEADTDNDGFVTGTELGEFLLKQVVNYSKGTQHPQYGKIRNPNLDKGDYVFIVRMPEPKKVVPSPEVEQEYWKSATKFDSAEAYEAYLKKYPDGLFSDLARVALDRLKGSEAEQQLWSSSIKLDSTAAYEDYLKQYPKGIFASTARDKIRAIAAEQQIWDSAAKSNTVAAYQNYIKKYPNGRFADIAEGKLKGNEAEQQLWSSAIKLDTTAAYEDYLKKYPKGNFTNIARDKIKAIEVEQQIWDSAVKLDTMAAYSEYGKKYPFGRYSKTAQERWTILRDRESIKNKDADAKSVPAVKLLQLPPEKIRLYNEKTKQLIVTEFPKEIKVQGQVNLTLSVSAEGKISVDSMNDSGLNIMPGDKRELVRKTIMSAVGNILLEPPLDRNGKSVKVANWQVSYSCGLFQGKLVLSTISI